jgi:hypothetical protein
MKWTTDRIDGLAIISIAALALVLPLWVTLLSALVVFTASALIGEKLWLPRGTGLFWLGPPKPRNLLRGKP